MKNLTRILIVEDHLIARIGIGTIVNSQPDMTVVAEAANGAQGVEMHRQHRPDVTLMDLRMPGMCGTDAIAAILKEAPGAKTLVLSSHSGDVEISRSLAVGARGFVLKDVLNHELINAIRIVHAGKRYIPPYVAELLAEHYGEESLTAGELRVLNMIVEGNSNKEIAARLAVTENTVKAHVKNLLAKLNVSDRTGAAMSAIRRGVVRIDN